MIYVICYVSLMSGLNEYKTVEARARLISDKQEAWIIDLKEYYEKHPEFKQYNNEVLVINNNECAYAR